MTYKIFTSRTCSPRAHLVRQSTCSISAIKGPGFAQYRRPFVHASRKLGSSAPVLGKRWRIEAETTSNRPLRLIQHKDEAFWFYRFLSIVYDKIGIAWPVQDRSYPCALLFSCIWYSNFTHILNFRQTRPSSCSQSWSLDRGHENRCLVSGRSIKLLSQGTNLPLGSSFICNMS